MTGSHPGLMNVSSIFLIKSCSDAKVTFAMRKGGSTLLVRHNGLKAGGLTKDQPVEVFTEFNDTCHHDCAQSREVLLVEGAPREGGRGVGLRRGESRHPARHAPPVLLVAFPERVGEELLF